MAAQTATCSQARLYNSDERMVLQVGSRNFACVEYPGIVENVGNALQTLGGIKSVSKVVHTHMHARARAHTHTHTYTHTHIHTRAHTHTQPNPPPLHTHTHMYVYTDSHFMIQRLA